jgi:PrtD family type I secretion system ABC transporter
MSKTPTPAAPPLAEALRACRVAFLAVIAFSMAVNVLMLVSPVYMMQVYDRVVPSGSMETLVLLTVMALGALLVMMALEIIRGQLMVRIGSWLDGRLGGELLTADIVSALQRSGARSAGGLRDLAAFQSFITGQHVCSMLDAPWTPLFIGVLFLLHPLFGSLALAGVVILFGLAYVSEVLIHEPMRRASEASREARAQADLFVRNANVVDAMGMMPQLVQRWQAANQKAFFLQGAASGKMGAISAVSRFVRAALQTLSLAVGAYLAVRHEATGGAIVGAAMLMGKTLSPVEQAISAWKDLVVARVAYGRLRALLAVVPMRGTKTELPAPSGRLTLENVVFAQPGEKGPGEKGPGEKEAGENEPVIRGVSFEVAAGEMLAIIGASAAGKSTLAQIIIGNWRPQRGTVRLDGADLATWDADKLGRHLGYLPQDIELFDGTVRDNIARLGGGSDDAVIDAATEASVHEMILRMPKGYDTEIGNGGSALSGGQRQRIALARALYGDPKLIVLDEPDASLDSNAEHRLIQTLAGLKGKATVVLITHRLSLLNLADKVLMMRNGAVEAFGTRAEVVARLTGVVVNAPAPGSLLPNRGGPIVSQSGPVLLQGGRR